MGKKAKKTVWRALTLNGHQSDSETTELKPNFSNTNGYQKFSKYTYSSQNLPIKKYQNEIRDKTTSPTNEEQKTTFNEDEYTRITTPRQDVLFKKSYLNKPKTYQTQTSTGTTTTSNSTNTCTPDHQSADGIEGTDLEYESPFMFPNGFIDPNGIFYLNSYEPYPYVFYNAQVCYPDYPASRTKRYSTDSLTESVSPQNEEVGYEQNGEEAPVINQICDCQHQNGDVTKNGQCIEESRRVKKKRRKLSRSKTEHEEDSSSEDLEPIRIPSSAKKSPKLLSSKINSPNHCHNGIRKASTEKPSETEVKTNGFHSLTDEMTSSEVPSKEKCEDNKNLLFENSTNAVENEDNTETILTESTSTLSSESEDHGNETENCDVPKHETNACTKLKADAQPFIPRKVYYNEAIPFDPSIQFVNLPPHCIPIPFINSITDFQSPPLLPAGVRVNCFPQQNPKIMTGYVVSSDGSAKIYNEYPTETFERNDVEGEPNSNVEEPKEAEEEVTKSEPKSLPSGKNAIDIAKIVSKLEEAAQQQQVSDVKKQPYNKNSRYNPRKSYSTQRPQYGARRENQYFEKQNSYARRYRKPPQGYRQQKEKPNETNNSQNDIPQLNSENERVRSLPAGPESNELLNYTKACKANIKKEESYPTEKRQENGVQIELRNNSEKVKASNSKECPRFVKHSDGKPEQMRLTQKIAKVPNQWISVSNRKKRKNKIVEEEDVEVEEEIEIFENKDEKPPNIDEDDQYESFDVSLLVDVVPANDTKTAEVEQTTEASVKEEIIIEEEKVPETSDILIKEEKECDLTKEVVESNSNNENKGLKKKNTVNKNETKSKKKSQKLQLKKVMITDPDINISKIEKIEESSECLNENKVELEVDLNKPSESKVEKVTIVEVQVEKAVIEEVKIESAKVEVEELTLPRNTNESKTVEEEVPNLSDETELAEKAVENILNEKKKKKKKQIIKTPMKSQSSESSNTTLNNFGGSYDFLLENSVLEDFEQKTNDECSEDMKKIIQNEIYSSFKEAADFGKGSKIDLFPGYDCLKKKCNIIKAMSFEEICLNVNSHILKFTNTNKESNNLVDVDFSNIVLPDLDAQPSTSKTNFTDDKHISLSGFGTNAIIPVKEKSGKGKKSKNSKSKSKNPQKKNSEAQAADDEQVNGGKGEEFNGKIKLKTNLTTSNSFNYQDIIGSEQPPTINSDSKQTLYPITQAVKEWMIRTRENTPDIEVLKSPNTIYKELFSTDINNDYQMQSKKKEKQIISEESSSANGEEEVTVWSITPQESCEDLLDCWENELSNKSEATSENKTEVSNVLIKEIGGEVVGIQNGCSMSAYIEEGEDVIEIYDSKYGTNEDFLKIKKEVEQKQKNLNIPKHGYLPYRAICCTIM